MAESSQPVPQWANPFLGNEQKIAELELRFNPVWLKWFLDLVQQLVTTHEDLGNLQGGTPGDRFHLTEAQRDAVVAWEAAGQAAVTGVFNVDGAASGTVDTITITDGLITGVTVRL